MLIMSEKKICFMLKMYIIQKPITNYTFYTPEDDAKIQANTSTLSLFLTLDWQPSDTTGEG